MRYLPQTVDAPADHRGVCVPYNPVRLIASNVNTPSIGLFSASPSAANVTIESDSALDVLRLTVSTQLDSKQRSALGQFFTPSSIAHFMAGRFHLSDEMRLLDAGAGVGILSAAFLNCAARAGAACSAEVWEIDPQLRLHLEETLQPLCRDLEIHSRDFIEDAVLQLFSGVGRRFTHAILNPPYKKINSASHHRLMLRKAGIETVNLYTAFVALSIKMLVDGGELVAIIPRSFCNGPYYRPFRELLLRECAIRQIHLFESRTNAFKDDDVLQENIIVHIEKHASQGRVIVSTSHDAEFRDYAERSVDFDEIVRPSDDERFIHIPSGADNVPYIETARHSLADIGLSVSTGPVIDFRVEEFLRPQPGCDTVPLLYPHHFTGGRLNYPKQHRKPNAIVRSPEVEKLLMPSGCYVVVKRFTSKEERRRIVATVIRPADLAGDVWGFENHLNVIHVDKHGMDIELAEGLSAYLNTKMVDDEFRKFSGHTQVNATDLRSMKFLGREQLREIGSAVISDSSIDVEALCMRWRGDAC